MKKKGIAYYWGLDFIANIPLKNTLRLIRDVGAVLLSATPAGAPILGILGITPSATAAAAVAAASTLAEIVRSQVKHADDPQP